MSDYIPPHTLQPTTPIRGIDAEPFTFDSPNYRALLNAAPKVGYRTKRFGAKRGTRGIIWRGETFAWTPKGYYRRGRGDRRPLQHILWEQRTGRKIPRGMEIWFKDRDRHNFTRRNMELIAKAELHERTVANGEVRQLTPAERAEISGKRWTKQSRRMTSSLLNIFEKRKAKTHDDTNESFRHLVAARDASRREGIGAGAPERNRRWRSKKALTRAAANRREA